MISNSSPLIFLSKINSLKLLKDLYNYITIPEAVKSEVLIKEKEGYSIIDKAIEDKWIMIENPKKILNLDLGKGENSAITLARENKDSLIIDDAVGIKVANSLNIGTIRTTTVIILAVKRKLLTKKQAISLINKLIENGYYISPRYYSLILTKLTE